MININLAMKQRSVDDKPLIPLRMVNNDVYRPWLGCLMWIQGGLLALRPHGGAGTAPADEAGKPLTGPAGAQSVCVDANCH